jgi:hypothetical protein
MPDECAVNRERGRFRGHGVRVIEHSLAVARGDLEHVHPLALDAEAQAEVLHGQPEEPALALDASVGVRRRSRGQDFFGETPQVEVGALREPAELLERVFVERDDVARSRIGRRERVAFSASRSARSARCRSRGRRA